MIVQDYDQSVQTSVIVLGLDLIARGGIGY